MIYVKIDRVTGIAVEYKDFDNIQRVLNKPFVWLLLEQNDTPTYDVETQKVMPNVSQPDLSDLSINVDPLAKRVQGHDIVALTTQELQDRLDNKISTTDDQLVKAVELILTQIATGSSYMVRSDFSDAVWNKVNTRRALRGEAPI